MEAYKQEFIKFMVESDVLKFGSFTLKSGRQSPFFMNAGAYVTGYQLKVDAGQWTSIFSPILWNKSTITLATTLTCCLDRPTRVFRWLS